MHAIGTRILLCCSTVVLALAMGTSAAISAAPADAGSVLSRAIGPVTSIATGASYSLALTASGQLYTFGTNDFGVLGRTSNATSNPTPTVVQLPGAAGPIAQFAFGGRQTLALTGSGQVFSWGNEEFAETGRPQDGNGNHGPGLVTIPGRVGVVTQIAAGLVHNLVVTASGQLFVFGSNEEGQLGFPLGDVAQSASPLIVGLPGQAGAITKVAGGQSHSLAITSSGQLYAWGEDLFGQLGAPLQAAPPFEFPTPSLVALPPGTTIDTVATGSTARHTLALVSDLAIATRALTPAQQGARYDAALAPTGGTAPLHWDADRLPAGLTLDQSSGVISGTPTVSGSFAPTVTLADAYASRASQTFVLDVAPLLPVLVASSTDTAVRPTVSAPRTTAFRQSVSRWLRGSRLASFTGAALPRKKPLHPIGTSFTFTLDQAANVTFTFHGTSSGRRVGARCVAATSGNARRSRCTRALPARALRVQAPAGTSTLHFEGAISRRITLAAGSYTVGVSASNPAGTAAGSHALRFTVG